MLGTEYRTGECRPMVILGTKCLAKDEGFGVSRTLRSKDGYRGIYPSITSVNSTRR